MQKETSKKKKKKKKRTRISLLMPKNTGFFYTIGG